MADLPPPLPGKPLPSDTEAAQQLLSNYNNINPASVCLESNALGAYEICLAFEQRAIATNKYKDVMYARILGYLILHVPSDAARREMNSIIHSCSASLSRESAGSSSVDGCDFEKLSELGETFLLFFIRSFKKFMGRTPASSDSPSRPSFNQDKARVQDLIDAAKSNHEKAKIAALYRDGYKCVVTGRYDLSAPDISVEEALIAGGCVLTRLAHIVPDSTYFTLNDNNEKGYAASVLAVLKKSGYDVDKINGDTVHSLYNVMTMQGDTHDFFDCLEIYFEETDTVNCYRVIAFNKKIQEFRTVTLTTPDPVLYPLPDPKLLALHATCAKVAHLSGAGEYLDKIDYDEETIGVLATDGGSFEVLNQALLRSFIRVGA
ncbi:hypothetical protein F5878DRAFT_622249 [Lentinula raphanica]|uniref:HNH nuclease domain-containing protein n=1 Tax=Lentinula raphanica TaxID=153919 RepID=A0AA38UD10_9AGAR|nr:hypothetical protein F5878DRAFT_622249 [Lentinula raphanica]